MKKLLTFTRIVHSALHIYSKKVRYARRKTTLIAIPIIILFGPLVVITLMNANSIIAAIRGTSTSPVVYWKLNEGVGTTTNDASGNNNTGTISGATWATENSCVIGKCLQFDGSNDSIQRADDADFDFTAGGSFTVSVWIKHAVQSSGQDIILSKFNEAGYKLLMESDGDITCGIDYDSTWSPTDSVTSTAATYDDDVWHHVACVKNANTSLTLYIDGVSVGTPDTSLTNSTLANSDPLYVGIDADGTSNAWLGFIDEVKIHNQALNQSQIQSEFNGGAVVVKAQTLSGASPVGYWKFDEGYGTTAKNSGNGGSALDATITNATWTLNGKVKKALDFESGSSAYLSVSDHSSISMTDELTITAWIKPESTTASTTFPIMSKGTDYQLMQYGDEIRVMIGGDSNYATTNTANLQTGSWYHVMGVYDGSSQVIKIYINGKEYSTTTTGTIPASISDGSNNLEIGRYANSSSQTFQIASTGDDGVELLNTTWDTTSTSPYMIPMGYYSGVYNNTQPGLRFTNINIAQGTSITEAHIEVYGDTANMAGSAASVDMRIYGDDVNDAAAWAGGSRPSQVTQTTASVNWEPTTWPNNTWISTPSITTIVQEILDRPSWSSGNDMRFAVLNNGTTGANILPFNDYSNPEGNAARLVVTTGAPPGYYDGVIDEVKLYNVALSSSQASVDHNAGASLVLGTLGTDSSGNPSQAFDRKFCPPGDTTSVCGPIAYWDFEEKTGQVVVDKSGNENHGVFGTTTSVQSYDPQWSNGKIGGSITGAHTTVVTVADSASLNIGTSDSKTITAWIRNTGSNQFNNPQRIVDKQNSTFTQAGYFLQMGTDSSCTPAGTVNAFLCFVIGDGTDSYRIAATSHGLVTNQWHHVAVVWDRSSEAYSTIYVDGVAATVSRTGTFASIGDASNSLPLCIAGDQTGANCSATGTTSLVGQMDELKIFNYAMTPTQIAWDYNRGKPIAHWKMDENTGSVIRDSSGNSNTSSTFTGNTAFASGKFNTGLTFDGTDDVVRIPETASTDLGGVGTSYSISTWFKISGLPSSVGGLIAKTNNVTPAPFWMYVTNTGAVGFSLTDSTNLINLSSTSTYNDSKWHHAVGIRDAMSDQIYLYVDGKLVNNTTDTTTSTMVNSADISIGNYGSSYTQFDFNGLIDDTQIYNYPLTPQQVKTIMNNGAVRWGPPTGTP